MAEKPKTSLINAKQPQSKSGIILKIMAIVVSVLILIIFGFAVGVYLKFIDVQKLATDMNLVQYPVINKILPKTNFDPVEIEEAGVNAQVAPVKSNQSYPNQSTAVLQEPQSSNPNIITKDDLEKQAKIKQQEEAKRISKLARLYAGMKPDEAIAIMKELDDPVIIAIFSKMEEEQVSKILALFDSKRAARLSQDMLKGQAQPPSL